MSVKPHLRVEPEETETCKGKTTKGTTGSYMSCRDPDPKYLIINPP